MHTFSYFSPAVLILLNLVNKVMNYLIFYFLMCSIQDIRHFGLKVKASTLLARDLRKHASIRTNYKSAYVNQFLSCLAIESAETDGIFDRVLSHAYCVIMQIAIAGFV